jgi:hypothetical protein
MTMALIYTPEADALKARDRAFTLEDARRALREPASRLKWMLTATDVGYSPYVMKIHSLRGLHDTMAAMSFLDCHTGEVRGEPITVDLTDRALVWPHLPSTLEGWSADTTDCAFVFFSPKIRGLTLVADDSGGGEGKWPRGASLLAAYEQICGLVREHLLSDDAAGAANTNCADGAVGPLAPRPGLAPDQRERLRKLVGGVR